MNLDSLVDVELVRVLINECEGEHQIVLKEKKGDRSVPISIGPFEALAIHSKVNDNAPARPMTHDLLATVISSMGATLEKVVVDAYAKGEETGAGTYHGKLLLQTPSGPRIIDCRPSDGIALALRLDAPLAVSQQVFEVQNN